MDIASHDMPHLGILTSSSNSTQDRSTVDGPFILNSKRLTPTLSRRARAVRATDRVDFGDPPKVTPQVGEHGETGKGNLRDGFARLRFELDFGSEGLDGNPDPLKFCE
jgi:hypothetical protein